MEVRRDISSPENETAERPVATEGPWLPVQLFPPAGRMTCYVPTGKTRLLSCRANGSPGRSCTRLLVQPPEVLPCDGQAPGGRPRALPPRASGLRHTRGRVASGSPETSGKATDVPTTGLRRSEGAGRDSAAQQLQEALKDSVA